MYICPVCGKPAKRLTTHHIIPRFLSISSDDDVMECCVSCHRKFDITFTNLLLWDVSTPPYWCDKNRLKNTLAKWREKNREKIRKQNQKWQEKKRKQLGIVHRPKITTRYPDLELLKDELSRLYWEEKRGIREIAKTKNLSVSCIDRWMKRLNVPKRNQAEGCRNYHRRDKIELIKKAEELKMAGLTCYKIAKQLDVSKSQAWRLSHVEIRENGKIKEIA